MVVAIGDLTLKINGTVRVPKGQNMSRSLALKELSLSNACFGSLFPHILLETSGVLVCDRKQRKPDHRLARRGNWRDVRLKKDDTICPFVAQVRS